MCNYPTKLHNKVAWLMSSIGGGDSAPTQAEHDYYAEMRRQAQTQIAAWRKILGEDVSELNQKILADGIPAVQPAREK
jgi:hypothetical protein